MLLLILIAFFLVSGVIILLRELRSAAVGYEDRDGFHFLEGTKLQTMSRSVSSAVVTQGESAKSRQSLGGSPSRQTTGTRSCRLHRRSGVQRTVK